MIQKEPTLENNHMEISYDTCARWPLFMTILLSRHFKLPIRLASVKCDKSFIALALDVSMFLVLLSTGVDAGDINYDENYYNPFALAIKWDIKNIPAADSVELKLSTEKGKIILSSCKFDSNETIKAIEIYCFISKTSENEPEIRLDIVAEQKCLATTSYCFANKFLNHCTIDAIKKYNLTLNQDLQIGKLIATDGGKMQIHSDKRVARKEILIGRPVPKGMELFTENLRLIISLSTDCKTPAPRKGPE